jgi:hypothetical protein
MTKPSLPAKRHSGSPCDPPPWKLAAKVRKMEQRNIAKTLGSSRRLPVINTDFQALLDEVDHLTIYIDEAWMATAGIRNVGVIAGVIFQGDPNTNHRLPTIKTHSYRAPELARASLESLWQTKTAMPFVFPLHLADHSESAMPYYDMLLQHAIRLLCGWLLPKTSRQICLTVLVEAIAPLHPVKDDATDFFRGVLAGDPRRYGHWHIDRFHWVEKNFKYVPYADLVAHLSLEHNDFCRQLGHWAGYKQLPGYVPFSLNLVPRLERLEHLESSVNLGDVIDLAVETGDSRFGRLVLDDIARRLNNRPDLQQSLMQVLEERYSAKARDLTTLRRAFKAVHRLITALPADSSPRMRLLWYLLVLQDANHAGDSRRIGDAATAYIAERARLKEAERELCAFADLNLAVNHADRWEFDRARATVEDWVSDPLFPALSALQRGRMHSALGQYLSMQRDPAAADHHFAKALALFDQAPLDDSSRAGERDQTGIYRAINAISGFMDSRYELVESVLGPLDEKLVVEIATSPDIGGQYRHHLLLRLLLEDIEPDGTPNPRTAALRESYIDVRERWFAGHPQHPWQLIDMYRGLLLWENDSDEFVQASVTCFDRAIATVRLAEQGATIRLTGGMIATVAACCFDGSYSEQAGNLLDSIITELPASSATIGALRTVLNDPRPDLIQTAINLLPFNYH